MAIDDENMAIKEEKVAIEQRLNEIKFNIQTRTNINKLYEHAGRETIFGRNDVSKICEISYSAAGNLIAKMKYYRLIEEVKGCGKGKYRFE